ncbi:bifunctional 4-hydroxy-2-oxoglutarate aldolase/2-dehydro-3-deoxy-phosphogluconate aldolase [Humibacter ginsenosidimutans]|uniref:Bifunctional 4-hydroxy-2-oxoglutarate aldolase/2-dehydro-3-deoxy-phosphogluconate aldolase n=1 Tax=Humibacter ginsenosidimutans TaxID=2599293 RepID=A0A5B8M5U2_9MICO|nr:bifunctional 4-hydroxy-2-oxoglutarate aldolase/2-dehydro-3-deoxy-phosphogluconate aldolase [Humibacter ginsenosidimutans]QDZ14840.1 bifunctional 4-hydroxy-2-oxoglutarate aldolase/2-dehydro-3-deoxy-phosphogluconate aldolase [Humibacter ginsenosidimutans]
MAAIDIIGEDRAMALIRASVIPDAAALADTLVAGGIHAIEFTFTTPDVERHIERALSSDSGALIGAGSVLTPAQARSALDAGAQFIATPGLSPQVAQIAAEASVPLMMGAFTPSEIMQALAQGVWAVKVFPAQTAGPEHFEHLLGPMPMAKLIASGGIVAENARSFLDAGAYAVTAGSSVVPAESLAESDWTDIRDRAAAFTAALRG